MNQALPLAVVVGLLLYLARLLPLWLALPTLWAALATAIVAFAYLRQDPQLLGKTRPALRLLLAPYLHFGRAVAGLWQLAGHTERHEITPGLWVGGWPIFGAPGLHQLDLTAEMPRQGSAAGYANVPMLDGAAMTAAAYAEAVGVAQAWREAGHPILIHCAYGHGRSVAVACGLLLAEGLAPDLDAAFALIQARRKRASLRPYQRAVVEAWWAQSRVRPIS